MFFCLPQRAKEHKDIVIAVCNINLRVHPCPSVLVRGNKETKNATRKTNGIPNYVDLS